MIPTISASEIAVRIETIEYLLLYDPFFLVRTESQNVFHLAVLISFLPRTNYSIFVSF